ncbi:VOC family protein [Polaromonas sp. YR568]|uniref:VOC family protein n=1 Tax=Polaromonas sp. YR568 TaxID=1855301 RepID=UPI00313775D1
MHSQLDHLVVLAATLDEGVAWCERTLGVTPGPGGEHPLMGTHNRLLSIACEAWPLAYLEIIAIHAGAPCARPAGYRRWFDLDDAALQQQLKATGPQLAHFVARTSDAQAAVHALAQHGLDRGEVLQASRMTPQGLLSWKITVRADGQRLLNGTLPTLIEWGDVHPARGMAPSGITLQSVQSVQASHTQAGLLRASYAAIGLQGIAAEQGPPGLTAALHTPRGLVTLSSRNP